MGTVFGYTQTDAIARYQRMRGKAVFYPIGWDDNGLATERRVQNFYGVRCDPSQPLRPGVRAAVPRRRPEGHAEVPISRPNFVELCHELTANDEAVFEDLFRRLGLSVDWSLLYTTIDDVSRRTSQLAFLRNLARGEAYSAEAPTLWDVDDRTAVAQAEIEDRERPGRLPPARVRRARRRRAHRHDPARARRQLRRPRRPPRRRALPAARRLDRAHAAVRRRGAGRRPPARRARQGHGHRHDLHVRRHHRRHVVARAAAADARVIGRDGRFVATTPEWMATDAGRPAYAEIAGQTVKQAQAAIVELLRASGDAARRAAADHPPGEVLRAGHPPARDRHQPPVVHPQRRPRPGAAATPSSPGARSWPGTPTTCATATSTGSRGSTATG